MTVTNILYRRKHCNERVDTYVDLVAHLMECTISEGDPYNDRQTNADLPSTLTLIDLRTPISFVELFMYSFGSSQNRSEHSVSHWTSH